ncbi:E3 ubiquitin-protein ligase SINA-like 10 [Pistacia vera]|uniref:E3 ubiquitin-protein ligase SINA-like 10 n=1 Tax=Pistacia vera TaxID=55513 RepID=UPI0012636C3E|nr:E3 ubiquitin-protein ligase SINA-like 10 [Pistacia vera]
MGRSKTWISGREDDGKRPIKSFGPNPKRQRKVAPVSQSKINLRDEIPEEERGLIEVRVEVKGRNENSCEEIEVGVEDKVRNEESCEAIEVEDERIEEEEKHEEEDKESYEIEEAAAANNGGKGESADTVKRSGNGSISVTLTDPELLDCPVCFDALTTPVFQEVAGFRRKQKMVRAKNTTTQGGGTSSAGV